jgi:hypothetical protein
MQLGDMDEMAEPSLVCVMKVVLPELLARASSRDRSRTRSRRWLCAEVRPICVSRIRKPSCSIPNSHSTVKTLAVSIAVRPGAGTSQRHPARQGTFVNTGPCQRDLRRAFRSGQPMSCASSSARANLNVPALDRLIRRRRDVSAVEGTRRRDNDHASAHRRSRDQVGRGRSPLPVVLNGKDPAHIFERREVRVRDDPASDRDVAGHAQTVDFGVHDDVRDRARLCRVEIDL